MCYKIINFCVTLCYIRNGVLYKLIHYINPYKYILHIPYQQTKKGM
jgi:hypothetical protein